MRVIKCVCGRDTCSGEIWTEVEGEKLVLWFQNDTTRGQRSIYLDANSIVQMINGLTKDLLQLTEAKDV